MQNISQKLNKKCKLGIIIFTDKHNKLNKLN